MTRIIDADKLASHKWPESECRGHGEGPAYRQGWNDAIDAIIKNEPTVEKSFSKRQISHSPKAT